jgi:hypothetical protein
LKSLGTGAFDPGRGCASPPGFNPNGSLRAYSQMEISGLQAKWVSWDFLKPEGLAYPLPVVVTTGWKHPMDRQARRADTPKGH